MVEGGFPCRRFSRYWKESEQQADDRLRIINLTFSGDEVGKIPTSALTSTAGRTPVW
jgi:hypothetical protein